MPRRSIVLALSLFCGCSGSPGGEFGSFWGGLPAKIDADASGYREADARTLRGCPTRKCLTVYVAPWCPYCRASSPTLLSMRGYLAAHDVTTRFIVGLDKPEALAAYAKTFGPDAMLDGAGQFATGGVPHFFVTDDTGHLLKDQAGVPAGLDDPKRLAAMLGLP